MITQSTPKFGPARWAIVIIFIVVALFGLFLDFAYGPPQWIILDDAVGRFLGFLLINLGPEIAIVGIGLTMVDFFITRKNQY